MKRSLIILLSAVSLSSHAVAAPEGYFVGGFGEVNITDRDKDTRSRFDFIDDGKGLGLELGYFYDSRWGGRIEWSDLEFNIGNTGSDTDGDRYGIDALYRLTEDGPAYAIMGLKHLEAGNGHTAINIGLGVSDQASENLSAFAEGTVYGGVDKPFLDFGVKMGLRYHFSGHSAQTAALTPVSSLSAEKTEPLPPKDLDQDGVTEDKDLCPDSDPMYAVDNNGCVVLQAVPVSKEVKVFFAHDSAVVEKQDYTYIADLADFMRDYHPEGDVEIAGHTSDRGDADYNMTLSEARAQAVADILTDEFGIDRDRVSAKGYGETRLLDDSGTAAAAKLNRRIEAVFTATEQRKKRR